MKSRLVIREHALMDDAEVVEVWYGDVFVASVYGADGPGVRVISKHEFLVNPGADSGRNPVNVVEVQTVLP